MDAKLVGAGAILLVFGLSAFTGIIPLSGVGSVTLSNLSGSCNATVCQGTVSVSNVAETSLPMSIWFVVKNAGGQTVATNTASSSIQPGATGTASAQLPLLSPGAYIIQSFSVNAQGFPDSNSLSVAFNTGSFTLIIDPSGAGSTVPAPGTYTEPPGATVTLTFTPSNPQTNFQGWSFLSSPSCPSVGCNPTANPLTFTVNGNYEVEATASSVGFVTILTSGFVLTITPKTATLWANAAAGPTTVTFSVAAPRGYIYTGWTMDFADCTTSIGLSGSNTTAATFTYAQLQPFTTTSNNFCFDANAVAKQAVTVLQNLAVPAGTYTSTPPAGIYYINPGGSFTVTASQPASGYCFQGWLDNGVIGTNSLTYTLTNINAPHALMAAVVAAINGQCGSQPPPGGGVPASGTGMIVGGVSMLGGLGLVALGLRRKR